MSARLAWPADLDAALLRCEPRAERDTPVRWGQLIASQAGIACEAAGFPRSMQQDDGLRDVEHMRGEINPGTGRLGGRIYVDVASAAPQPGNWDGMSGAALWCGPLLVGVIAYDRAAFASRRLAAEPVARLIEDAGFRAVLGEDVVVEAAEFARPKLGLSTPGPAYLLRAESQTARFRSRTAELAELIAWCQGSGVRVQLLTGPGGQGKTRLARELGTRLGWAWTWLPEGTTLPTGIRQPLLVTVDYAETRPDQVSEVLLAALAEPGHIPIRILLLARSAGDWWERLRKKTAELDHGLAGTIVHELSTLEDTPAGRKDAFDEALHDYGEALTAMEWPHAAPEGVTSPDFGDPRLGSALRLQMTALAGLLGKSHPGELPEDVILRHESRYWNRTIGHHGLSLHEDTLRNAVAAVVLCGATSQSGAIGLLTHVPGLRDQSEDVRLRGARWLRDLYPPPTNAPRSGVQRTGQRPYWGSLQPDLLAEHLVAGVAEALPGFLAGLLAVTSSHQDHQALTVLTRASVSREGLACAIAELLLRLPKLALPAVDVATQAEDPATLLAALNGLVVQGNLPVEVLTAISGAIPESTQALALFAVTVNRILIAEHLRMAKATPDAYPVGLETAWASLSYRLMMVGRHQEAMAASERAVAILEQMAEVELLVLPNLATAVNNQTGLLSNMSRPEEALAVIQRAVEIRERLADAHSDARMLDLAVSLGNLAGTLATMGRIQEALAQIQRAVTIYEQLAETGFDVDDRFAGLAFTLTNLSQILADAGSWQEALTAAQRAVSAHERLAEARPDAWLPFLANSLTMVSARLTDVGRYDEALAAVERAVDLRERLAESLPDAHLPGLAASLTALSRTLAAVGRQEEALAASRRAVAINKRLAAAGPANLPQLASSLNSLADDLHSSGRQAEALDSSRQAVAIYDQLIVAGPGSQMPSLAGSLITLSAVLAATGDTEGALAASERAVAIYEQLAETNPAAHTADWASALNNLAVFLSDAGRHEDALAAAQRAVSLSEPLAVAIPDVHLPHLAMHLGTLAARLNQIGRTPDAVAASERAVELYERAAAQRDTPLPALARSLRNLSVPLWNVGRREDSLAAIQRAAGIYDRLAADDPQRHLPELAGTLRSLSERLAETGHGEEAREALQRAAGIYDRLAADDPQRYLSELARALGSLSDQLAETGHGEEALEALQRAVGIYDRLAAANLRKTSPAAGKVAKQPGNPPC